MRGYTGQISWLLERKYIFNIVSILFVAIVSLFLYTYTASANQFSWAGENPTVVSSEPSPVVGSSDCNVYKNITVDGEIDKKDVCVTYGGTVRIGTTSIGGTNYFPVVSLGYDSKMYKLRGICGEYKSCLYLPSKDILITRPNIINGFVKSLVIYKNFASRLARSIDQSTLTTEYTFNSSNPDYVFKNADGYAWPIVSIKASENEDWLVFEARERAVMLLNTDDFDIKRLSVQVYRYGVGLDPDMEFDVTDDGRYVAMMGRNTPSLIFDVTDTCGDRPTDDQLQNNSPIANPCPSKDINSFSDNFIERFSEGYNPKFNFDGGELTFYAASYSVGSRRITLRASGYQAPTLDYLALGDSYSSGEGDLGKQQDGHSYYLPHTNDLGGDGMPTENCHVSSRSYPFHLATSYNISDQFQSVACSGAMTKDIRYASKYTGQNSRLKALEPFDRLRWQGDALATFVPGRIEQIRFVKKYQPKAITLTAGGNDVDFARKIEKCASSPDICEYVSNLESRAKLGYEVQNQFKNLKSLYGEIRKASPNTKIYILGYPSFINPDETRPCGFDDGHLKPDEKELIDESFKYMNTVIEDASKAVGVNFINNYNSLNGGRICDVGGEYVTGLHDINFEKARYGLTFHPNALGHQKIAEKVQDFFGTSNLINYNNTLKEDPSITTPTPPEYFGSSMSLHLSANNSKHTTITSDDQTKTQAFDISLDEFSFGSAQEVNATIHSTPTSLGNFVTNSDGSLRASVTIPQSVSAGLHTLVLTGNSYSGEPIELYQTILVRGSNPNDIDEDGIPDISDPCLFIVPIGIDDDHDGIDDMCDPETSQDLPRLSGSTKSPKYSNSNSTKPSVRPSSTVHKKQNTVNNLNPNKNTKEKGIVSKHSSIKPAPTDKKLPPTLVAILPIITGLIVMVGCVVIWLA